MSDVSLSGGEETAVVGEEQNLSALKVTTRKVRKPNSMCLYSMYLKAKNEISDHNNVFTVESALREER